MLIPALTPAVLAAPAAGTGSPGSIGTPWLWGLTIGAVVTLFVVDFVATRDPHDVSMKEAVGWSAFSRCAASGCGCSPRSPSSCSSCSVSTWCSQWTRCRPCRHPSLVHPSYGLSFILAFIGVKLLLHRGHGIWAWVPEVPTLFGLGVIVGALATVAVTSLLAGRRRGRRGRTGPEVEPDRADDRA